MSSFTELSREHSFGILLLLLVMKLMQISESDAPYSTSFVDIHPGV